MKLKADYYNNFIDHVLCKNIDSGIAKLMINGLIGCFGTKNITKTKLILTNSINEASYHVFTNEDAHVSKDDEEKYFEVRIFKEQEKVDNVVPFYNQILDVEAMELHKVTQIITKNKGKLIYVNTDQAIGEFATLKDKENAEKEIKNYFWDEENKVHKYKEDSHIKHKEKQGSVDTSVFTYQPPFYNVINDVEGNDFQPLVDKALALKQSFQIDGPAGCGKSTLLRAIIAKLEKDNIKALLLAPTNKACRVLHPKTQTIHSFSSKVTEKTLQIINKYEYIIIDEKSMVKEMFYRLLFYIKQNTQCKLIICGDWKQLKPVKDRCDNFDYQNSTMTHYLCDGNLIQLSTCRRADRETFELCQNVQNINPEEFGKVLHKRALCYHNNLRKKYNAMWMKRLSKGKKYVVLKQNKRDKNSQDIKAYVGLPLIACKTSKDYDIANGEEFVISKISNDIIQVKCDNITKEIEKDMLTTLFYPAYCITIHKSQGCTFNEAYTILEWKHLDDRLKYVALSRTVNKNLINIIL